MRQAVTIHEFSDGSRMNTFAYWKNRKFTFRNLSDEKADAMYNQLKAEGGSERVTVTETEYLTLTTREVTK